jgi:16S rRNA (uracil1498-N3)-methyltransferase
VTLAGAEGRHATTVRRLMTGERVDITDGAGTMAECVVVTARAGVLELKVLARQAEPAPQPRLVVVQAIPKGDRGEQAVETMTEVGVDVIVPWSAERCVVRWRDDRAAKGVARWRSTAVAAAKQSRRSWFPEVTEVAGTAAVAGLVRGARLALLLDPDAAVALAGRGPAGAAGRPDVAVPDGGDIILLVGPEGGISPPESGLLTEAGAVGARLGPTVLRASSAGAVAAALVLSAAGRWS